MTEYETPDSESPAQAGDADAGGKDRRIELTCDTCGYSGSSSYNAWAVGSQSRPTIGPSLTVLECPKCENMVAIEPGMTLHDTDSE